MNVHPTMGGQTQPQFRVLANADRTATTNSSDFVNTAARGVMLFVDVDAVATTENFTVAIQVKDFETGDYVTITAFSAISTASDAVYFLYPGAVETGAVAAVEVQGLPLPIGIWRVRITHSASGIHNYAISASHIW